MFAPRSHSVLPKLCPPIEHGMVKLPGSFSLGEILLLIKALEHLVIATVSCSSSFRFLDKTSFRNFTQFGISSNASTNRMLICNCFRMFKNFLDYVSWFVFWSLWGRVSVVNTLSSFFSQSPMVQLCPFFFFLSFSPPFFFSIVVDVISFVVLTLIDPLSLLLSCSPGIFDPLYSSLLLSVTAL